MTEKRKGPRYVPAALATLGAMVLLVAACQTPVPTDPADVEQMTAGKQVSHVDPADEAELHRILEEEDGFTLVIDEVDGDTYVIDGDKVAQLRQEGHAESPLRPAGYAIINGRQVDVVTEGNMIEKGEKLKVVKVEGSRVVVRELDA